ncbi:ATP-binding protein [Mycobacteroides chelonae]|uniref:ATP-binding protein n=1 Tax=Mycobacteroides chelonae TaxID=1774 RepID=UPI000E27357F|nr:ATP-binding protein [Mycobacteroides chelonae]AYM40345.1 ATP-binding protein [[Mycobacterium] chelonae subsp. gwanakae]
MSSTKTSYPSSVTIREAQSNDPGVTITVSGRTGSGKSAVIRQLRDALEASGVHVVEIA